MTRALVIESCYIDDGWQMLAEAVILQAVDDYRRVLHRQKKYPDSLELQREIHSIEQFIRSGWFETLCDLDGRKLLMDLKTEVHE